MLVVHHHYNVGFVWLRRYQFPVWDSSRKNEATQRCRLDLLPAKKFEILSRWSTNLKNESFPDVYCVTTFYEKMSYVP